MSNSLKNTLAYYAAFVILGLAAAAIGPTLPGLAEQVQSSISQISILFVLRSLGYLGGSIIAGRLYDRVKGHPVMVIVILLLSLSMTIVPILPILWILALFLLVIGLLEGVLDVGGNTLLVWVHRDKMGPYMNGLHFFFGLGAFLSPIIIAQTVRMTGDISWAYWSLALLMLPSAVVLSRLPSPSPISTIKAETARPILPFLVVLIALFYFFYVGAEVAFGGWVFSYATTMNLTNATSAAYLTSGFWGSYTAGRLVSIPLASRFSPKLIILSDLFLIFVSLGLVILIPGSYVVLWIGTIGVGFGMASIFPTMLSLAEKYMTMTGFVTSWFFVGGSLGGMTIPWIIGQLFNSVGPQGVFWVICGSVLAEAVLFLAVLAQSAKIMAAKLSKI